MGAGATRGRSWWVLHSRFICTGSIQAAEYIRNVRTSQQWTSSNVVHDVGLNTMSYIILVLYSAICTRLSMVQLGIRVVKKNTVCLGDAAPVLSRTLGSVHHTLCANDVFRVAFVVTTAMDRTCKVYPQVRPSMLHWANYGTRSCSTTRQSLSKRI